MKFRVAPQLLTTSNFIGPWYHAALLFSGLGSIVLLFGVLFSHQIREDLVRAATSLEISLFLSFFPSFFSSNLMSNLKMTNGKGDTKSAPTKRGNLKRSPTEEPEYGKDNFEVRFKS